MTTIDETELQQIIIEVARALRRATGRAVDDCEAEANWQVALALDAYDPERGVPLNAWVHWAATRTGFRDLRRCAARIPVVGLDDILEPMAEPEVEEWTTLVEMLAPEHQGVIRMRFGLDLSWGEIGRRIGVSHMTARRRVQEGLQNLARCLA